MAIGAQVAGKIEGQHTPPASQAFAQQITEMGKQLEQLKARVAAADPSERAALETQIKQMESEKDRLRHDELSAIEWKPLWGKPAIFAAIILVLFILLFKNNPRRASDHGAAAG